MTLLLLCSIRVIKSFIEPHFVSLKGKRGVAGEQGEAGRDGILVCYAIGFLFFV